MNDDRIHVRTPMPIPARSLLLASLLLPLIPAGAVRSGSCPADAGDGGCVQDGQASRRLAWRDYDSRGDGDYRGYNDYRSYNDQWGRRGPYRPPPEPPRQGPLPPQAYPGGQRPACAPGTHLEGYDCVRDPSGPPIIDQPREGCPRDYYTNRKGTKCIRDGFEG
jgi:hypothetical protein